MTSTAQPSPSPLALGADARARAELVRAMVARWQREDAEPSDEPDWDVDTIPPLALRARGRE
jgi:hypothetical protein